MKKKLLTPLINRFRKKEKTWERIKNARIEQSHQIDLAINIPKNLITNELDMITL